MRVIANFATVRGDDNEMYTLHDEFDVTEERYKELRELGAVTRVDKLDPPDPVQPEQTDDASERPSPDDRDVVVKRGPGRPRKTPAK